jgi:acetolactate synthase I/II/III large subunit
MIGAECLLRTLVAHGVDTCFMNPGTSEMQFVAALDRERQMRGVLCLFEGVCSGAADGYARMRRHPAATLLHLGPGLGNALANLHNARKAFSPVVNIVGEHTTSHLEHDAPLSADIVSFARPVSGWVHTLESASAMGARTAEAIRAACGPPAQVATFIVPADLSWSEAGDPLPGGAPPTPPAVDDSVVREIARLLRSGQPTGFLLSGSAVFGAGLAAAGRVAAATGAHMLISRDAARMERGAGRYAPARVAYFPEHAEPMLAGLKHLVLVESKPPVSFFGYPSSGGALAPADCAMHVLAGIGADGVAALNALADRCAPRAGGPERAERGTFMWDADRALTVEAVAAIVAAYLPEGAIISDELVSSSDPVLRALANAAPHDHLPVTGGSIGQALPVAVGAAIACPGRKVVALEADGSGMYTLQALWTMARERLDVVTVIFANHRYRILDVEMQRTGARGFGPRADSMLSLADPQLDWVALSKGNGVEAHRAATAREFAVQFERAIHARGPALIEAVID